MLSFSLPVKQNEWKGMVVNKQLAPLQNKCKRGGGKVWELFCVCDFILTGIKHKLSPIFFT